MTTSDSVDLVHELAVTLERKNRHLSDEPAEGVAVEGAQQVPLSARRLRRSKKTYNARELWKRLQETSGEGYHLLRGSDVVPKPGDFMLARVTTIGQHNWIESHASRRRHLFEGDEIIVAYGNRYAPDQFLAEVPRNLNYTNLVAAGGMAGRVIDKHASIQPATVIEPLGLIGDDDGVITMQRLSPARVRPWRDALAEIDALDRKPTFVVVFGSSMNSGKSTTLGCLVNGLSHAERVVHAGKATGTGAGNDAGLFNDAGADLVVDFTDFGLPSTFLLSFEEVKDTVFSVMATLAEGGPDVVVVEISDGIYQGETASLLADADFRAVTDRVLFACGEALSAAAGTALLREHDLPLVAISGLLTSSPLITAEARAVVDVPIIPTFDLCMPDVALGILEA